MHIQRHYRFLLFDHDHFVLSATDKFFNYLQVLNAAVKVDKNARKMMEFSAINVETVQGNVERAEQALRGAKRSYNMW